MFVEFQMPEANRDGPRRPILKACGKAQAYEPHPEHDWEKRAGWPLHCEGVPEVADQPPCTWIEAGEQAACGKPAPAVVRARTSIVNARVALCVPHKRKHDNLAAHRRSARTDAQAS